MVFVAFPGTSIIFSVRFTKYIKSFRYIIKSGHIASARC